MCVRLFCQQVNSAAVVSIIHSNGQTAPPDLRDMPKQIIPTHKTFSHLCVCVCVSLADYGCDRTGELASRSTNRSPNAAWPIRLPTMSYSQGMLKSGRTHSSRAQLACLFAFHQMYKIECAVKVIKSLPTCIIAGPSLLSSTKYYSSD